MANILEGLKVIDCGSFIAAPVAGTVMADFGADVIKIEPPGMGDAYRHVTRNHGMPKCDHNYAWLLDNRNKRGLALNLATPEGQEVVHRLVKDADVFITNQPLAVRKKLGIDYERLAALNDRLIYASFTGYGETGDEAAKPGFDLTAYWARSGLMDQVVPNAGATPARALSGMGDHPSGISLFAAITLGMGFESGPIYLAVTLIVIALFGSPHRLKQRYPKALEAAERGDSQGFVRGLKERGYFTGNEGAYIRSVSSMAELALKDGPDALGRGGPPAPMHLSAPRSVPARSAGFDEPLPLSEVAAPFVDSLAIADEIGRTALRIIAQDARDRRSQDQQWNLG